MRHAHFLKATSQEMIGGKWVDVLAFSVCRCGERFGTDQQLEAHILHPGLPQPKRLAVQDPGALLQSAPALLVPAAKESAFD